MRYLALLLFCSLASPLFAAEPAEDSVSYDAFGKPEQTLKTVTPAAAPQMASAASPIAFPACDDPILQQQVRDLFAGGKVTADESIVDRRRRLLALKNICRFEPLNVADFRPEENYEVANILITAKINDGLKNEDFRLCGSDNPVLKRRVYLLMRPLADGIGVEVVNYRPGTVRSFTYQK